MSDRMKFATVMLVIAVLLAAVLINSWRAHRSFTSVLDKEGFSKAPCDSKVVVRGKDLLKMQCWRGPLAAGITGDVVTGHIPSFEKSDYLYFVGVVVAPTSGIDDTWFQKFTSQDTYKTPDGRYAVLWNLMDTRESIERVLAELRASLPR
ncbi:MAG: hypothetical protein AB7T06_28850 [Kofleriaceae bacterium]